jgi:hypothetical protein
MAWYKRLDLLKKSESELFDKQFQPADISPHSGVYRCATCGYEDVSEKGKPFPPQNHAQHDPEKGPIRWFLVVGTNQI